MRKVSFSAKHRSHDLEVVSSSRRVPRRILAPALLVRHGPSLLKFVPLRSSMEDDSPVLCWTRQEELLVRIASYVQDTKTLSVVSRCTRYCYEMRLPRRCKKIDVYIVDTPSLLLFVKRHVDATYQCRSLEVRRPFHSSPTMVLED